MPSDMTTEDIENLRNGLPLEYLTDITQNHLFFYLLDTIRDLGYNEYKLSNGSLVAVDLDRARWKAIRGKNRAPRLTFCHLCKISENTLRKLQDAAEDNSLAIAVVNSLGFDPFQLSFSKDESKILQQRIDNFFKECLNPCITKYGLSNVVVS